LTDEKEIIMAGSLNKVMLIGNVGKDPEIRTAQDGSKLATFTLATSETWRDKQSGERKDRTEWHRVVIFNDKLAEIAERYVKKGSRIFIEGQLQTRKWTDQSNVEKYTTEIVISRFKGELTLLDTKAESTSRSGGGYDAGSSSLAGPGEGGLYYDAPDTRASAPAAHLEKELDDEIPF
jgi:single-strand DNA-binding protein